MALVLGCFLGKDVTLERLTPFDRPATANLKALCGAFLGFHFRHDKTFFLHKRKVAPLQKEHLYNLYAYLLAFLA